MENIEYFLDDNNRDLLDSVRLSNTTKFPLEECFEMVKSSSPNESSDENE